MVDIMSPQYIAMSACDAFSNFGCNQPTGMSENPSQSTSPPCPRLNETQSALNDNIHQNSALRDDDVLADDDVLEGCLQSNASQSNSHSNFDPYGTEQPKLLGAHGSKFKASTAERRATHNAIERARRESLNGRFLELARALPTMHNVKRPSKSVIVNKSLEWICESQVREYELARENAFLRNHVNELRAQLQMEPLPLNRPLVNQSQVPYKLPTVHSQRATRSGGADSSLNVCSTAPYPAPCRQPTSARLGHNYESKQQPTATSNVHEVQSSAPTQPADNCKSMAGPFPTSYPQGQQRNCLASNFSESSDGSDKTIEQLKLSRSRSFGLAQSEENIPSIYFPGLSIHTDSSSPFQPMSESDGLLSTAGSSPPSDRLDSGPTQVGLLGRSVAPVNHQHALPRQSEIGTAVGNSIHASNIGMALPMETQLGCHTTEFDAHSLPNQHQPSQSVQFTPSNYLSSLQTSSKMYDDKPQPLPQVPRGSLAGGTSIDSSMLNMFPVVNPNGNNETSTGFPIGAAWIWG